MNFEFFKEEDKKKLLEASTEEVLEEALTHLHWLVRGGETSHAIEKMCLPFAALKEIIEAREFLEIVETRKTLRENKNEIQSKL